MSPDTAVDDHWDHPHASQTRATATSASAFAAAGADSPDAGEGPEHLARGHRELRRRALVFALLSVLACVVVVAVFESSSWAPDRVWALDLLARAEAGSGGARFAPWQAPALIVVGVLAGGLAGLLGMGGGVMKVAGMLVVFQLDILLARAVSLTTMFLATATASRVHWRSGAVRWSIVSPMLVAAVSAVLVGMFVGNALPRALLTHLFAFFALFLGFNTLAHVFSDPQERGYERDLSGPLSRGGKAACATIGSVHGFVCGLLGISGGVIALPLQQVLLRVPVRHAVANSVVVSAAITGVGSVAAVGSGIVRGDFAMADVGFATLCIGGGAVVGAQIGARLTGRIRASYLKLIFVQVAFTAGLLILFK